MTNGADSNPKDEKKPQPEGWQPLKKGHQPGNSGKDHANISKPPGKP